MKGRKPILSVVKAVTGKKGRIPPSDLEPEYKNSVPTRPSWVRSKYAKSEWDRVTRLLDAAGVLTVADGNSLAMYCYIVGEINNLTGKIAKTGYLAYDIKINEDTGEEIMVNPKTNPLAMRLENYIKELRSYSALFGLDPANRTKIRTDKKPGQKPEGKDRFFK
jgi:P27 family predicted phage terminase small subunit